MMRGNLQFAQRGLRPRRLGTFKVRICLILQPAKRPASVCLWPPIGLKAGFRAVEAEALPVVAVVERHHSSSGPHRAPKRVKLPVNHPPWSLE
jgi:hypothetical protein